MTLVYFYVEGGITKYGSVSLAVGGVTPRLLALMGVGL